VKLFNFCLVSEHSCVQLIMCFVYIKLQTLNEYATLKIILVVYFLGWLERSI